MRSFFKEMKRNKEALAYSLVGFVVGLLLVRFGIFKTAVIILFTIIPFYIYRHKREDINNWANFRKNHKHH